MPDPAIRLVVFDWDGTLVDSIGAVVECTQTTLAELRLPRLPDGRIRDLIGLGLRETVEALCPGCGDAEFLRVVETYRSHWIETYRHRMEPFPGVGEMLRELKRAGYLLAVATGKSRRGLHHDFDKSGLGVLFDASRTVDEAQSKPNPQMLIDLLAELGVAAPAALMVGDTVHDLLMAAGAGVPAVAVASGAQPREVLVDCAPLACLDSVLELPAWLAARLPVAAGEPV